MKQKPLSKKDRYELMQRNIQWSIFQWKDFCEDQDFGLVVADGQVVTVHRQEVEYTV